MGVCTLPFVPMATTLVLARVVVTNASLPLPVLPVAVLTALPGWVLLTAQVDVVCTTLHGAVELRFLVTG